MAATMPRPIPITSDTTIANRASSIVAGTYSSRSVRTGRWLCSEMPRFPCSRFFRYTTYCTGSGRSSPYWWRKAATAAGSPMARWPRLAAAGSPGTRWVTTNATSVMPMSRTTPVPSRCRRKRRRSRCRAPIRGRGTAGAVTLAELTEIDEPQRVRLQVLYGLRADQDLGRLNERHERARGVHRPQDLLVQGLARRVLRGARRGVAQGLQRGIGALDPARPQPDQGAGQEVEVVGRVGEVRSPVPQAHRLLAAAVAVERHLDRLALQLHVDPHLLQVLLHAGGQGTEADPVHLDIAGIDQVQRRVPHARGRQVRLGLDQVVGGAGAGRQAAEEHGRDDAGRLYGARARQLDQARVVDPVPDRLLELRVRGDLGDLRVVVGEQEEQVWRGAVDDLHTGHALSLGRR